MKQKLSTCCLLLMAMLLAITSSWGQTGSNQPTNLMATPPNGGGSIAFTAPSINAGAVITNYEYSTNDGASWVPFLPTDLTSPVVITGLTNGTTYAVKLRAVVFNGFGFTSSPVSAAVSLTPASPCTPTTSTTTITNCGAYTWNGNVYTSTGVYTFSTINAAGCDSTATLNLTVTYDAASLTIGANFQGGKIGYILQPGDPGYDATKIKGFVISAKSYAGGQWAIGNYTTTATGITSAAIGTGAANSAALVSLMGPGGYTAYQTDTLTLNGYTDWYLPSKDELEKVLSNFLSLNLERRTVGPYFASQIYATSTELSASEHIYVDFFSNGNIIRPIPYNKTANAQLLPVRSFEATTCAPACVPTSSTTTVTSRGLYGWNGVDYTESGFYNITLVNAAGCDSIATLNLTILPAITTDTVQIGTLYVSTKNLDVTRYRNGDIIPEVRDSATWRNLTTGAWCWVKNDSANYSQYGKLYNWYAVNDARGLAPAGYHIPNQAEATEVSTIYRNDLAAYIAPGINIWRYTSNGTNISGLAAYPAGIRKTNVDGDFVDFTKTYSFWTSLQFFGFGGAGFITWARDLDTNFTSGTNGYSKAWGMSVRVIKNPCSPNSSNATVSSCISYNWNGVNYTNSGVYTFNTTNVGGCDSVATLNLTINASTSSSTDITSCDSYTWNENVYTSTGVYTFSSTNAAGCDSTATLNLTINASTSSSTDITSCDSYTWNGNVYTSTGVYTFSTINAAGCDSIATLNLTINVSSVAAVSVSAADSVVSYGSTTTLTVNGGSLGTGASWKWYKGSCGGTSIGEGSSITVTIDGNATYYVRAEGTCNTTNCVSKAISVRCGATSITTNAANNTICPGSSITLTAVGALTPGAQWKWYKECESSDSYLLASTTSASRTFTPTKTTTYYLRSVGGLCGTTACLPITVTVTAKPATPVAIIGNARVCTNTTATYSILSVSSATSYTWTVPANISIVSGQGTTSITVSFANAFTSGNISVVATNCAGSSAAKTLTVARATAPTTPGTISGPTIGLCKQVAAIYSVAPVTNATSYTWTVPSGAVIVAGQGTKVIIVNFTNATLGASNTLSVTASNCGGTSTAKTLSFSGVPAKPTSISGSAKPCKNAVITYSTATVAGASSYIWTVPSGWTIQAGQNTNTITVKSGTTSGSITVKSSSVCGTSAATSLSVSTGSCTGRNETPEYTTINSVEEIGVNFYPNPTSDVIHLTANGKTPNVVEIYNLMGQRVVASSWKTTLSLSQLSRGTYLVKFLYSDNKVVTQKLIKK